MLRFSEHLRQFPYATPQSLKNVLGHQAYVLEAVKSLAELKPIYMNVESDGVSVRDWFVYGMASNTDVRRRPERAYWNRN